MGVAELYQALGELHHFESLEEVLDYSAQTITAKTGWSTSLVTFYLNDEAHFGTSGCPDGTKERFRSSFRQTSLERRKRKRQAMLEFVRPGTNICFLPSGSEPRPSPAFITSWPAEGSWRADDRLMIFMRDWSDAIIGVLSLDNPSSGNRPDEAEFERLVEIDRFINIVGKIAENRFWSLRLEESEQAHRAIFDHATVGLLIFTPEGKIVAANPAVGEMHGHRHEDLVGQSVTKLVSPDSLGKLAAILEAARAGQPVDLEARSIHADGTPFDVEIRGRSFPYRGEHHFLVTVRDVTERNRMLYQLVERQKEESVVAMAGGLAHDFNNVLMGVTGSLALLKLDLPQESPALVHCARMQASAERLRELTTQLLSVARGIRSEPELLRLGALVEETLGPIHGMAGQKIAVQAVADIEYTTVEADRVQLKQVLLNLAMNACDAMTGGGTLRIEVGGEVMKEPFTCPRTGVHPAGTYAVLRVADDGEGIDAESLGRLFEPYFSTRGQSRGLGMTAVLGIVKRHRGVISVQSDPGKGTVVEVLFPASRQEPSGKPKSTGTSSRKRRTLLLVDDQAVVRDVTSALAEQIGWKTIRADSGLIAVELYELHRAQIDLVLLDQQMPGMIGTEVCTELWKTDPEVRVVLSSGHGEAVVREDVQAGGSISGFLQKPYSLEELQTVLEAVMDASPSEPVTPA